MVIELQVIAGAGFRSPRPKSVGLGQNLPGHDGSKSRAARAREDRCHKPSPVACDRLARRAKFRFAKTPNQWPISGHPVPARGAVARRHERGMGCGGRESVGAQVRVAGRVEPRERFAGAQDERRFSVRQNRVVLTPVAGAKSAVATSNPTGLRSRKIRRRR